MYWSYPILPFGILACTFFPTTFLGIAVSRMLQVWCKHSKVKKEEEFSWIILRLRSRGSGWILDRLKIKLKAKPWIFSDCMIYNVFYLPNRIGWCRKMGLCLYLVNWCPRWDFNQCLPGNRSPIVGTKYYVKDFCSFIFFLVAVKTCWIVLWKKMIWWANKKNHLDLSFTFDTELIWELRKCQTRVQS